MTLFRVVERAIGFLSIVAFARLLSPADFGLVAMATAIIAILGLLGAFSFDSAIIQNPDAGKDHLDTVWTISLLLSCFNAVALFALAWPVAWFYDRAQAGGHHVLAFRHDVDRRPGKRWRRDVPEGDEVFAGVRFSYVEEARAGPCDAATRATTGKLLGIDLREHGGGRHCRHVELLDAPISSAFLAGRTEGTDRILEVDVSQQLPPFPKSALR